ncbi:MAG: peptide deformylase [Actinobacteria bacterium]|jgi:peptide deformylase|nr:peptide deformylase [Actinomycetota bacterium]NDE53722.1 peptide deformylase [Actinomycetota bacterium]
MSIQPIRFFGDPVLTTPAVEVSDFDKELRTLVQDLTDTMIDAPGAGLAAPQIGVPLRVFVWHVDDEFGHLVNPSLDLSDELQEGEEGCLSLPDLAYEAPRAMRAVARGWNMYGEPITVEGTEFLARALQHETDHLNGVLFIDRLSPELRKQAMRDIRQAEWFLSGQESGINPKIKVSPHFTYGKNL